MAALSKYELDALSQLEDGWRGSNIPIAFLAGLIRRLDEELGNLQIATKAHYHPEKGAGPKRGRGAQHREHRG